MFLRCLTIFILGLSIADRAQMPPKTGSICGSLEDENSQPAADTWVTAEYLGPHSGPRPASKTDSQGHYCIHDLAFGEYRISAADDDKGYPDIFVLFFAQHAQQASVTLSAAAPNGNMDARIPYKAGFLNILLIDSEAGKPLSQKSVSLALRTAPDLRYMHIGTISDRSFLIPPNEDVYLNVTSPGYGMWPDDGSKGMLLNLLPGQKQTITVPLHKIP